METIVSEFPSHTSERKFVVVCYEVLSLDQPVSTPVSRTTPPQEFEALMKEALLAPTKNTVDVVLARAASSDATRVWIATAPDIEPRLISQALMGPVASTRFAHLTDHAAQQWAIAGGLQSVQLRVSDAQWQCQVHRIPNTVPAAYFSVATAEQQFSQLHGDEVIWFTIDGKQSWSRLPGGQLTLWAVDVAPAEQVAVRLDTIVVDLERRQATLLWRGTLMRPNGGAVPSVVADMLRHGARSVHSSSLPPAPATTEPASATRRPLAAGLLLTSATPALDAPGRARQMTQDLGPQWRPPSEISGNTTGPPAATTTTNHSPVPARPRHRTLAMRPRPRAQHTLIDTSPHEPSPALPFRSYTPPASTTPSPPPSQPSEGPPAQAAQPAPIPPRPSYALRHGETAPPAANVQHKRAQPTAAPPPPQHLPSQQHDLLDAANATAEADAATPPAAAPVLDLEAVARLDAEMQMGAVSFRKSLRNHNLTLEDLAEQRSQWQQRISDESKRGNRQLQQRYDKAQLARYEEIRGKPITLPEYAQLQVAAERMTTDEVLTELGLPAASMLVITRVFATLTADSAELRRELRACVRASRRDD